MKDKMFKSELVREVHKLNIWRKKSFYESFTVDELWSLYLGYVKLGKIEEPKFFCSSDNEEYTLTELIKLDDEMEDKLTKSEFNFWFQRI